MQDPHISKSNIRQRTLSNSNSNTQYPLDEYANQVTIAKEIIGGSSPNVWSNALEAKKVAADGDGYLKNRVFNSTGGHSIHLNDHENSLTIVHSEGGGIKYYADGSLDISTPKGLRQEAGEEFVIHVDADGTMRFTGNLKLKVDGDFDVDCMNFNLNVAGNKTETVAETSTSLVGKDKVNQVTGGSSTMVGEAASEVYLGGLETSVKGTMNNNVQGDASFVSSSNMYITSEDVMAISSDNVTMSAQDLTVQGGSGVIGGTAVDFVGNGGLFDEGVQAPTFHGDLTGTADQAIASDTAVYASRGGGPGGPAGWSNDNTPVPSALLDGSKVPTSTKVLTYLQKSGGGIRRVIIDAGNFLKNFVNKKEETGGLSTAAINTSAKVRGKLRNTTNRTNGNFVSYAQSTGNLCPSYFEKTPSLIGRVLSKGDPIVDQGQTEGGVQGHKPLEPKKTVDTITVDGKYNPLILNPATISGKTQVGPGTSISKFLANDDPVNMNWIRDDAKKTSLAKYYYLHAKLLQSIKDNTEEFENYRLEVAEGLYRPGPEETIETGSLADLRRQGRAVVYKLVDNRGEVDLEKTFDLAAYWMHTEYFEKMILDYDTIDCNTDVDARVVIIFPELTPQEDFANDQTSEWRGDFRRDVETQYNGNVLSQGELVEVKEEQFEPDTGYVQNTRVWKATQHRYQMDQNLNPPHIGYDGTRGKIDPTTLVKVQEKSAGGFGQGPILLEKRAADRWRRLKSAGEAAGFTMELNAGYRSFEYQRRAYLGMKNVDPGAAVAKAGVSRHGAGLAIDLANCSAGSELWNWMKANAWKPENGSWKQADSDFFKYKDPFHWSDNGH